jgi:hypothetical protein
MPVASEPGKGEFVNAPEGLQQAVCVDVVDLGVEKNPFNEREQHKIRIVWESEYKHPEKGTPLTVAKKYTLSLHEKAKLRSDLEAWKGRRLTADELKGFETENMLGENCQLQVVHNVGQDGKTYANVNAIVPVGRGMAKLVKSAAYVRSKDRPSQGGGQSFESTAANTVAREEGRTPEDQDTSELITKLEDIVDRLTGATHKTSAELYYAASKFEGKDGGEHGFDDPHGKSAQWLGRTLTKLRKMEVDADFAKELMDEEVPF